MRQAVRVKVCGITNLEDALTAVQSGADALGFIFAPSPRRVTPEQAGSIIAALPVFVNKVGVFLDHPLHEVLSTMKMCGLDTAQLHGAESADYCRILFPGVIKSFRVRDGSVLAELPEYRAGAYLLDGYDPVLHGGTGQSFDWEIARSAASYGPIILSGGLNPQNVDRAIAQAGPYAVDVCSGVESAPGRKDHGKLRAFLDAAKNGRAERRS